MSASLDNPEPLPPAVMAFHSRGHPRIAWLVILLCVVGAFFGQRQRAAAPERGVIVEEQSTLLMQVQARVIVAGAAQQPQGQDWLKQAAALNTGNAEHRLRYVVLIGELAGPNKALEQLHQFGADLTPQQAEVRDLLQRLYTDYAKGRWDAPSLDADAREALRTRLGWFGDLALAPAKSPDSASRAAVLHTAYRTALLSAGAGVMFCLLGFGGGVLLLTLLRACYQGRLRTHFVAVSPAGGIYAETFAVWMVLYMGLTVLAGLLAPPQHQLAHAAGAMLLSLTALAWPCWRGLSWRQVRHELGLFLGARPRREALLGVATYVMAVPLMMLGLLVMLVLMRLQHGLPAAAGGEGLRPEETPMHPIVHALLHLGWWGRVQIFVLAAVVAPVVEETMFRGVLYRHLREAGVRLGTGWSALLSAVAVSFVFAVVHPQGPLGVPPLMGLALAFALAREWRGTLLPSMIAHGLNNGLVTLFVLLTMT